MSVQIVRSEFPAPGVDWREAKFAATLTAYGTTIRVQLELVDGRPFYAVTGPRYRATWPACGFEHVPCAAVKKWRGRCPEHGDEGLVSRLRGQEPLCRSQTGGVHAEHVMLFAHEVIKTYGPAGKRAPRSPIGVPVGTVNSGAFLPLAGFERVHYQRSLIKGENFLFVTCDSAACRDERGRVIRLPGVYFTEDEARQAADEHRSWHRGIKVPA